MDYVYTSNIAFEFRTVIDGAWSDSLSESSEDWTGASVTQRYIVVYLSGNFAPLKTGGQILLTNQNTAKQNGVWQVESMCAALNGSKETLLCLRRAAKYKEWGDYIGRILYGLQPLSNAGNWECLAAAGAVTLWDPHSVEGQYGQGRLFFDRERPILLF